MQEKDRKRIFVVEDETHIAEGLKLNLTLHGYDVKVTDDGVRALSEWKAYNPHLIVLDLMLPGIDGISVLQNIRLENERIPILVLSAKGSVEDKIKGLKYGVDDYLAKPFDLEEFLLRVDRLVTKSSWYDSGDVNDNIQEMKETYDFGNNRIDFSTATADCNGEPIKLTEQEVKLLKLFIANRGQPLSRKKLLEIGWGYTKDMTTRTVDNFIVRFRKYFEENPKKPTFFKSCRSVGYIFENENKTASNDDL